MRKSLLLSVLLLFTCSYANSQDSLQGKNRVSAGYGGGNLNYVLTKYFRYPSAKIAGPVYVKYMRAISKKTEFGIDISAIRVHGTVISYTNYFYDVKGFNVNLRANYIITDKVKFFKPYFGVGFGFQQYYLSGDSSYYIDYNWNGFQNFRDHQLHFSYDCTLGFRIMPIDQIGLYCELGLSQTWFQGGVITKF
ncbi:MAG TPA: hypothetical protein VE978_01880 [Chitinophagales bacterium]|nr:hypothetical protein [Chitinophagales bacterium]